MQRMLQNLFLSLSIYLGSHPDLWAQQEKEQHSSQQEELFLSSKPLYAVSAVGASTTGPLVEASIGSIHKGCRHRFYCHSSEPISGFLGPEAIAKPLILKDQPGVYPAPLMGPASLTFTFNCHEAQTPLTPVVVRPDGIVFQGLPMTAQNSPQTLVVSSPAQTGIYTLFILAHERESLGAKVQVEASISTQPQNNQSFHIKSIEYNDQDADLISAEFVYISS